MYIHIKFKRSPIVKQYISKSIFHICMKVSHTIMYQCWFILYEESTRNVICIGSSFMHFSDRKCLFYLQNSFSIRKSQRLIVWKMHEIVYTSFQNQSTCTRRQNILHSIFSSSLFILLFINLDDLKRRIILVQANILSHTKIIEHQIFSAFKPY